MCVLLTCNKVLRGKGIVVGTREAKIDVNSRPGFQAGLALCAARGVRMPRFDDHFENFGLPTPIDDETHETLTNMSSESNAIID